jgi:hypothetical protein
MSFGQVSGRFGGCGAVDFIVITPREGTAEWAWADVRNGSPDTFASYDGGAAGFLDHIPLRPNADNIPIATLATYDTTGSGGFPFNVHTNLITGECPGSGLCSQALVSAWGCPDQTPRAALHLGVLQEN